LRNVLSDGGGATVEVGAVWLVLAVDCCPGMCWVCWLWSVWLVVYCEDVSGIWGSITGMGGRFSRSGGMSGGAFGG
jgi:hypothetical protein